MLGDPDFKSVITNPDPTTQVRLAIEALREIINTKIDGYDKLYVEKFNAFTKLHDQLAATVNLLSTTVDNKIDSSEKSLSEKISDLKDRLLVLEGRWNLASSNAVTEKTDNTNNTAIIIAGIAAFAALALVAVDAWAAFANIKPH